MKYSFAELGSNILTRKFGGTTTGVAEPYLSGYFFVWFERLPADLAFYASQGSSGVSSVPEIQNILAATCTGVTPPGGTLGKVEFTGLGGIKWAVPGNVEYGNEVTVKFIEFSKTPILDILHGWVKMIRDYRVGITDALVSGSEGAGYNKGVYAAIMYYWTTAPDAKTIEYYACYDGVFPARDPQELFTGDVETVARLDIEVGFNVDYTWHEPWVKTKCETYADLFMQAKEVVKNYRPSR
jgi:hypothetical protein